MKTTLQIKTFGIPEIATCDALGQRKILKLPPQCLILLVYLAVSSPKPASRDELAQILWNREAEPPNALNKLSNLLWKLQETLKESDAPASIEGKSYVHLALEFETCHLDYHWFTSSAEQIQELRQDDACDRDLLIKHAKAVLNLYTGRFLQSIKLDARSKGLANAFNRWRDEKRLEYERQYHQVLHDLISAYRTQNNIQEATSIVKQELSRIPDLSELYKSDEEYRSMWDNTICNIMQLCHDDNQYDHVLNLFRTYGEIGRKANVKLAPEIKEACKKAQKAKESQRIYGLRLPEAGPALYQFQLHVVGEPSHPHVGRQDEVKRLRAVLQSGLSGVPAVACVTGPVGIGKTRLILEATKTFSSPVWLGGGSSQGIISYDVVRKAIKGGLVSFLRTRGAVWQPANLSNAQIAHIAQWLPDFFLSRILSDLLDLPHSQGEAHLFEALTCFVTELVRVQDGVILALDDLHDADEKSLAWIGNLIRSLDGVPLGIVLGYRQTDVKPSLLTLLESLDKSGIRKEIPLTELPEAAVAELARNKTPDNFPLAAKLARRLITERTGNPLFILETLRVLPNDLSEDSLSKLPLADSIRDVVQTRLPARDSAARRLLDVCAIFDKPANRATLQTVGEFDEPRQVAEELDKLVRQEWLVRDPEDWTYQVAHSLYGEVIYHGIGDEKVRLLHRGAAKLHEETASPTERVAYHFERGGQDLEAAKFWLQAGRQAGELFDADGALRDFQRGLNLRSEPDTRFDLLAEREEIQHALGQRDNQKQSLDEMAQFVLLQPDETRQITLAYKRGRWLLSQSRWHEAENELRQVSMSASSQERVVSSKLLLANALAQQQRRDEARNEAQQALQSAQQPHRADLQVECLLTLSKMAQMSEDLKAAENHLMEAKSLTLDDQPRILADLSLQLGRLAFFRSSYGQALSHAQEARKLYGQQPLRQSMAEVLNLSAMSYARLHRYTEALEAYKEAGEQFGILGYKQGIAAVAVNAAALAIRTGHLWRAEEFSRKAHQLFVEINDQRGVGISALNLGTALMWSGKVSEAESWYDEALQRATVGNLESLKASALVNLGTVLVEQHDAAAARDRLSQGLALRQKLGHVEAASDATCLAIACVEDGNLADADKHSREAVDWLQASETPGVEYPQRIHFVRAQILRLLGRHHEAQAALDDAQVALEATLRSLPNEDDRSAYRENLPFNRSLGIVLEENRWPDRPTIL